MSKVNLYNINVISQELLPTPMEVKQALPLSAKAEETIVTGRKTVCNILDQKDPRLFIVVGPCSIHDTQAALDYARRLKSLADKVSDTLYIIMRVYFEKPRTTVGWKGLINDPYMDDSFHIEKGLYTARKLLVDIAELGLPTATEALDPISPQYLGDLISWNAIGARTTESQTHREMSSGLSTPVGFKNGTDGSLQVAINAMYSASQPHHFLGINQEGQCAVFHTRGNRYGHVVLRGGGGETNYSAAHITRIEKELQANDLPLNISIDCSHANSKKDPANQTLVAQDCVGQILAGNRSIKSFMLESNIGWGNQPIPGDLSKLQYGVSVTDASIDWPTTEEILLELDEKLKTVIVSRREFVNQ